MSFTFQPGNIVIDEASHFGSLHGSGATDWPDPARWRDAVRGWLSRISTTRVGSVLLQHLAVRPVTSAGVQAYIVAWPARVHDAFTDGVLPPSTGFNTTATPAIFVTYSPSDAFGLPLNADPMKHPGPVLTHELTHVLLKIHGLAARLDASGAVRPIATWHTASYPSHNEFLATTVQNMLLSEQGSVLADGYSADDPAITSSGDTSGGSTTFGLRAAPGAGVDLARFVNANRPPLEFLANQLPAFTSRLASLTGIAFNPFAQMRTTVSSGAVQSRGSSGAARRPGPTDISPR